MSDPIVFLDMRDREKAERARLSDRQYVLTQTKEKNGGQLPPELQAELDAITAKLNSTGVVDPLFRVIQAELAKTHEVVDDHVGGKFPGQQNPSAAQGYGAAGLTEAERALAAVYGILERDALTSTGQDVNVDGQGTVTLLVTNPALAERFIKNVAVARGEYNANRDLFDNVLRILAREGKIHEDAEYDREVKEEQWATVAQDLAERGVPANDFHLALKTRAVLASADGADDGAPPSSIDIDLPDLEAAAEVEIIANNLHAMQAIYFAAMLEELKVFQVVDKLVELFQYGMLPFGKSKAGDALYEYWKKAVNRMSEVERRNLYARTFGLPGGDAQGSPNREFNDLWLRFVSAVSSYNRQFTVDDLLRSNIPITVSQEQVRKSGRDLAANLSLHGYGLAYFAATELQTQVRTFIDVLSDPDVKLAYGARDMWQVIDQVATLELGGAKNSIRYRTMATSGAIIIRWLADHGDLLAASGRVDIIDLDSVRNNTPRARGTKPTTNPTDSDLIDACNQWLSVTGTPDTRVEEYAQPTEGPNQTSRPIQIPQVARDLLESVGVKPNGHVA